MRKLWAVAKGEENEAGFALYAFEELAPAMKKAYELSRSLDPLGTSWTTCQLSAGESYRLNIWFKSAIAYLWVYPVRLESDVK